MTNFKEFKQNCLKNSAVKIEYDALEPEFAIIQEIINLRKNKGLSQKQLSSLTGITQGDISKLENGNANPSLNTLQRIANATNTILKLEFVPK